MALKLIIALLVTTYMARHDAAISETGLAANFELAPYLGQWHEIARLDHRFERNMQCVTAEYSMLDNGKIKVVNRGYNTRKQKWSTATARAHTTKVSGRLRVSFFRPFYSDYNVLALGSDYQWALVAGSTHRYLWILARRPVLPPDTLAYIVDIARRRGFDTSKLLFPATTGCPSDNQ